MELFYIHRTNDIQSYYVILEIHTYLLFGSIKSFKFLAREGAAQIFEYWQILRNQCLRHHHYFWHFVVVLSCCLLSLNVMNVSIGQNDTKKAKQNGFSFHKALSLTLLVDNLMQTKRKKGSSCSSLLALNKILKKVEFSI